MLCARALGAALGAAVSLLAVTASAQDPALPALPPATAATIPVPAWPSAPHEDDVVVMNDGGMARGAVIEMLPKDHVSVRLSDGRTMIIPWDRVHHVEQGAPLVQPVALTPAPAPRVSAPAAPASSPEPTGTAYVHLEGAGAVLERERAGQWVPVCGVPCDRPLELDAFYRVGGHGVRNSKPFRLLAKDGDRIDITANVSTTTAFGIGITLATLGAVVGTISYCGLAASSAMSNNYKHGGHEAAATFGIAMLASAGVGTAGLVMTIANEKTGVKQSVGARRNGGSSSDQKVTARVSEPDRLPAWTSMGSTVPEHRGAPIAMSIPLLGGRF